MNGNDWHTWCNEVVTHLRRAQGVNNVQSSDLKNIQETLKAYDKLTKRMLLWLMLVNTGMVIINGILLYYNGYRF